MFPRAIGPALKGKWVNGSTFFLLLTGLAAIGIGVFAEPVAGDPTTYASGTIHIISVAVMFFSLAVAQLLIGWQAYKQRDWRG